MTDEELSDQEKTNSIEFNGIDSSTMGDLGFQEKSHPCMILNSKNNDPIVNLLLKSIFEHGHFCQVHNNTADILYELESIKTEKFKYNSIDFFKIQPIQDLLSVTSNRTLNTIVYHNSLKNPKHPNPFTENCNVDDVTNQEIEILQNTNHDIHMKVMDDIITSILEEDKNPDFQAAELKKKIEITTKTISFFNHESFIAQKTSYNKKM